MSYFTSVVPSGDGVIATWSTLDDEPSSTWSTRPLWFDATPRAAIRTHLTFPTAGGVYVNVMSLAVSGVAFAGLVDDPLNGCRFVPLDGDGDDLGASVVVAPPGTACSDLAAVAGGFSFLSTDGSGDGRWTLSTVAADGSPRASLLLATASPSVGGRLVLRDDSFLLGTFEQTDAGALATSLQHLAPDGSPLASPFLLTDSSASLVSMAETHGGALTAWLGDASSIFVLPVDGDGRATSTPSRLPRPGAGPLYGFTLAPAPNGDALLAFFELVESTSLYDLFVVALAPDGTPRGPVTPLGTFADLGVVRVVVEAPAGLRALLVFSGGLGDTPDGVQALPLGCLP
jgi:hypothetical protein